MDDQLQSVELGELKVSAQHSAVLYVPQISTGVALLLHDFQNKVGGLAHIVLPESSMSTETSDGLPGKFANLAIPALLEQFTDLGGKKTTTVVRLVGGAQLFNFGGGGGNIINIGARNAIAIRASLFKMGFVVAKADTGGNKSKSIVFKIGTGQALITPVGGKPYEL